MFTHLSWDWSLVALALKSSHTGYEFYRKKKTIMLESQQTTNHDTQSSHLYRFIAFMHSSVTTITKIQTTCLMDRCSCLNKSTFYINLIQLKCPKGCRSLRITVNPNCLKEFRDFPIIPIIIFNPPAQQAMNDTFTTPIKNRPGSLSRCSWDGENEKIPTKHRNSRAELVK